MRLRSSDRLIVHLTALLLLVHATLDLAARILDYFHMWGNSPH